MKDVVIYARYSSLGQKETSIEDQVNDCKRFIDQNGLNLVEVYADAHKTGRSDNRDEFQRMLKDAKKKQFDTVLVWKLDRFGRNVYDSVTNENKLKKCGVELVSLMENIPEGPAGSLYKTLMLGMAEYYSLNLSENVKRGMYSNAEKVRCNGRLPIGYKSENGEIVEDEEYSPLVKAVFSKILEGKNRSLILRELKEEGYSTPKGTPLKRCAIDNMVKNERYTGTYIFGDVVIEDAIPALVDKETFYRAQEILGLTGFRKMNTSEVYLFSGKLVCGVCGEMYTSESGKSRNGKIYRYYKCKTKKSKHKQCENDNLRKEDFEQAVLWITLHEVLQSDLIDALAREIKDNFDRNPKDKLTQLESARSNLERKTANLLLAVEDGAGSVAVERLKECQEELIEIEGRIAVEKAKNPSPSLEAIRWALGNFKSEYLDDLSSQVNLVSNFIKEIIYTKGIVTIVYNFCFTQNGKMLVSTPGCSKNYEMASQEGIVLNTIVFNEDQTFSYSFDYTHFLKAA